jgi:aminoglycoside phosphotransferase family enzyme/predicted kinase
MNLRASGRPEARSLIAALQRPECYPHPVVGPRLIETHISWVLLTGEYAYKIKKPVDLGFVDFTTLALRRRYCEEELRLNRRLAPELYLAVVAIRGTPGAPVIGGKGRLIDYAVKMREFPQEALASRALARGRFDAAAVDAFAAVIAGFHAVAPRAPAGGNLGGAGAVLASARQNFEQMLPLVAAPRDEKALHALRRWTENEHASRRAAFKARAAGGAVRECHGDLHLGNVVLLEGRPVPFDCIEFNEALRWIDVMSELAFVVMDLADRGHADLAWRFLNRYLEATGDYEGVKVLRFYLVYRALVRAKVHLMRAHQPGLAPAEKTRLRAAFRGYLRLAQRLAARGRSGLIITHGLSGCGKTTTTDSLIAESGAVRMRSDLERKRMHRVAPLAASGSALAAGIYTRRASAALYRRLGMLARTILKAGWPVVLDATFLKRTEREAARVLAAELDAPFVILNFRVPLAVLRTRVAARHARADDASEADLAVLERQIAAREPLTPAEMGAAVTIDGTRAASRRTWRPVLERLG